MNIKGLNKSRKCVGYVRAVVLLPLYEGDKMDCSWDEFIYEEPGIGTRSDGSAYLGVCRRDCTVLEAKVCGPESIDSVCAAA